MKEYKGLPVFKLEINDESEGLKMTALVDAPATEVNWMAFSNNIKFASNEFKRHITAPMMVANTPIYRNNKGEEFYVIFEPAQIEKMMKKFFKENRVAMVNEMHNKSQKVNCVYLIESWIKTGEQDKSVAMGFEVPDGTWMVTYFVEDEQYWNDKIITGEFNGFSLEGDFDMVFNKQKTEDEQLEDLKNEIQELLSSGVSEEDVIAKISEKIK